MADEQQPSDYSPFNDPDGIPPERLLAKDWALDGLLDLVFGINDEGGEEGSISLTLLVDGTIVSGTVVTGAAWHKGVTARIRPLANNLADAFETIWTAARDGLMKHTEDRESRGLSSPPRSFIHFKDATIFSPLRQVKVQYFRVPLKDVSGWDVGSMTIEQD